MTILWLIDGRGPRDQRTLWVCIAPHVRQPVLQQGPKGRDVHHDVHLGMGLDALLRAADLWRPIGDPEDRDI